MERNLLTNPDVNSDLSTGNNLDGEYFEFLKDDEVKIGDDDANIWTDDTEEGDGDDWWDPSKPYIGWDYIAHFGEDAWNKLYQARLVRHHNIVLREFTKRLPNISEQAKDGLFDAFCKSNAFGAIEHNALLEALADSKKGWSLYEWDEFYYTI
jgi:hypothetical protein